jgi:hypothetical protein
MNARIGVLIAGLSFFGALIPTAAQEAATPRHITLQEAVQLAL